MPVVNLKHPQAMTREEAAHAWSDGQTYFWIAVPCGNDMDFVRIGKQRATVPLNIRVDLQYGEYILGCGYGKCRMRRRFIVDLQGVRFL